MMFKRVLVVICALGLFLGPTYRAYAWMCCDPWGGVGYAAFVQQGTAVVGKITSSVTQLVMNIALIYETWDSGFAKAASEQIKHAASEKVYFEGDVAAHSQLYMEQARSEAIEQFGTSAQQNSTLAHSMMLADHADIRKQDLSRLNAEFADNFYAAKGGVQDPYTIIARHQPYCSSEDMARDRCSPAASSTMQNADLTVNTIFQPGDGQYDTLSDEERAAAKAFVMNIANPMPMTRPAGESSASSKVLEAYMLSDQAALTLVANSLNAQIANRTRRNSPK